MNTTTRFVIGIDGGVSTGIAIWDRIDRKFAANPTTVDFWTAFDTVHEYRTDCLVIIEDPAQNKPVFRMHNSPAAQNRMASNVGSVKRESTLLIEGLRRYGYEVLAVKPTRRKLTTEEFQRITGYKGRTSQHARDAAMLCFGY